MTAFMPCPACGAPVHPIAGRCKHCKTDLVKLREQHAQAMRHAGVAPAAPMRAATPAAGVAIARPAERAQTPLPMPAYPQGYGTTMPSVWARRWPLLVGGAAVAVIAISLVILLRGKGDATPTSGPSGPSRSPRMVPDDMNSNPQGPLGSNIPSPGHPDPDPGLPAPQRTRPDPTDAASFAMALVQSMCDRLDKCGVMDANARQLCAMAPQLGGMGGMGGMGNAPQCHIDRVAARACFDAIDNLSCDQMKPDLSTLMSMSNTLQACTSAAADCQ